MASAPAEILTRRLAVLAGVLLGASCTSLWGIDELEYDRTTEPPTTSSSSGGAAGSSGTTSSSGGATTSITATGGMGGAGGSVVCGADCEGCVTPACVNVDQCAPVVAACQANPSCEPMVSCMHACSAEDVVCQTACIALAPLAAPDYYRLLDCAGCAMQSCGALCEGRCDPGCSAAAEDCAACVNSSCAHSVCSEHYGACVDSAECMEVSSCILACDADSACKELCAENEPEGAALYRAWARCSICTRPACWDVCFAGDASCRIWGDP